MSYAEIESEPTSPWRLDGYRAVVTGSTKGIGLATAREFVALGASVLIVGRDIESVLDVVNGEFVTGAAHAFAGDISTPAGRAELVDEVAALWPDGIDILVNNAGTNVRKAALDATDEEYDRIMDLNLRAVRLLPIRPRSRCERRFLRTFPHHHHHIIRRLAAQHRRTSSAGRCTRRCETRRECDRRS